MQHEEAARFFDGVSGSYRDKYTERSRFHQYFFNERLAKATSGLQLDDTDVLDIGSGTGDLYDHLRTRFPGMRFHATDVSAGMLAQSPVPAERKFTGHAYDHPFPTRHFDVIFLLGVTTYLTPEELARNLAFMARSLKPGGVAIITFSNRHGLDTWMRALARWPLRLLGRKDKVMASGLKVHTYSIGQARKALSAHLRPVRWDLLNHTVFPFGQLVPGPSVALAVRLGRIQGTPAWLRWLSSDLLVRCQAR